MNLTNSLELASVSPTPAPPADLNPDALAAQIARCVAEAFAEEPKPLPIQVANRLLQLKTPGGHKLLWTRFDLFKLFGLYTKELERQGTSRNSP